MGGLYVYVLSVNCWLNDAFSSVFELHRNVKDSIKNKEHKDGANKKSEFVGVVFHLVVFSSWLANSFNEGKMSGGRLKARTACRTAIGAVLWWDAIKFLIRILAPFNCSVISCAIVFKKAVLQLRKLINVIYLYLRFIVLPRSFTAKLITVPIVFVFGVVIKGCYDRVKTILGDILDCTCFITLWADYFDWYWYCFHSV